MAGIFQAPRFEKDRKHTAKDWLGLSIVAAAAIIAVLFIFTQLTHYFEGTAMNQFANQLDSAQTRYEYAKAHSTSTPEKTYEAFRQALLNNDLDGALKWIYPGAKKEYEETLTLAYKEGKLSEFFRILTPIEKLRDGEDTAQYGYISPPKKQSGQIFAPYSYVEFERDTDGLWKLTAF